LQGQDRSGAGHNNVAAYLEGYTVGAGDYTFASTTQPTDTINDRVLAVTQADLMAALEPVVAARIERDIKPYLQTYFTQWSAFPYPAQFDISGAGPGSSGSGTTRSTMTYVGNPTQSNGLLPLLAVQVSGATTGSPIVVSTSAPHGLSSGDVAWVFG